MSFLNVDTAYGSPRPNTASSQILLSSSLYNDQVCRQLPPMSSSSTLPDTSAGIRLRSRAHSPKRLSVFKNRSRSNTTNSTSSSYQSPASSMTSIDASSRRSSQDGRTLSSFFLPGEKEGLARSLISRGSRILKRQGSKTSLLAQQTIEPEEDMVRIRGRERSKDRLARERERLDGLGLFYRSHRTRHSDMHEFLKRNISEPFDFQHVTHTHQSQLPPIEYTHPHDLATEFSIIRASQRPKTELKGIRAESLFYRNLSSEDLSTSNLSTLAPDSQSLYTRSPPHSPVRSETPRSPNSLSNKRASRSVENFSRPVSRVNKPTPAPCIIPPPRHSSKTACSHRADPTSQTIDALLGHDSPPPVAEQPSQDYWTSTETQGSYHDAMEHFPDDVVHAFTTDDYSPKMLRASPVDHVSGLANIPEENEPSWRNSHAGAQMVGHVTGLAAAPEHFGEHLHAPFIDRSPGPEDVHSPILGLLEDACEEPSVTDDKACIPHPSVKVHHPLEDSWEDDIDYCYEHAAESNSNFDWQRVSLEEVRENLAAASLRDNPVAARNQESPQKPNFIPRLEPSKDSKSAPTTPEPQAAFSFPRPGSVSPAGSAHSYDYFTSPGKKIGKYRPELFQVVGQPLEGRLSPLPIYGGVMPDIQESDEEVIYAQPDDQATSVRSSCSPLSKCNSQESMILSRAASIARKHRSSTSTNSVPDLVHSPGGSRDAASRESTSPLVEQAKSFVSRSPALTLHARPNNTLSLEANTATSPSESTPVAEKPSVPAAPFHDRAKSESILDTFDMGASIKNAGAAARKRSSTFTRGINHRKTRTSYSLFPSAAPPTPKQNSFPMHFEAH
ncbi:hypothetical protein CPC735_027680 [Coccidioides posadasii C735 delta SOWgp]|uniref:CRIB domain-containing protein n=1 Tax=Coccidioides posadasii (strain C735) TaxID=222929 RepID=C5P7N2_COCP7|nr:hypothetical protein CPC735_027680 [Coccidioides posadasii C735 delta SOWgp]EER27432.1 hypothetical protein CPC735_027680 [Coccidioides posadasii C735 delta SOWgp]|eukprot:XP_003069577.1 hypothetical protein CPC735_027680 [Coccidioides posadasii C735 delta SOWgp]